MQLVLLCLEIVEKLAYSVHDKGHGRSWRKIAEWDIQRVDCGSGRFFLKSLR